jgi:hypothetical protein
MKISFKTETPIYVIDVVTNYSISSTDMAAQVYLCREASKNNNRLNIDQMLKDGWPKANVGRLKKTGEDKFNLWDSQGLLTEDGLQASEKGIVHVPENGRIRLWVINHPIAGIIPIHATEESDLPSDRDSNNTDKTAGSCLQKIHQSNRFKTLLDSQQLSPRWFELLANYQKRNWFSNQSFSTNAILTWNWRFEDGNFVVDDNFKIKGEIKGLSGSYNQEKKEFVSKVIEFGPINLGYNNNSINPQDKFREWLSKGEYSASPWDVKHGGMRRPFNMLTNDEKMRQTIHSINLVDDQISEWDSISIDDIPLITANENDATAWSHYLLKTLTPGYTSKELTDILLDDILNYPVFCTVNSSQIAERVAKDLEKQIGDPRMQKLLLTADDLDSSFIKLTESKVRRETGGVNLDIETGKKRDYSELLVGMTANMKGNIQSLLFIDAHAYSREVPKSLAAIKSEMKKQFGNAKLNILTRHYNDTLETEREKSENREHLYEKLQESCDKIVFSDDGGSNGRIHHRYVRILTNQEERWFTFNDTILGRFNRGKNGWIIANPSFEENFGQSLSQFENKNRGPQ